MTKPLVEVEWVDSCSNRGWQQVGEYEYEPSRCRTAGYLIARDASRVSIAHSIADHNDGGDEVNHVMTIPTVAVRKIRKLR